MPEFDKLGEHLGSSYAPDDPLTKIVKGFKWVQEQNQDTGIYNEKYGEPYITWRLDWPVRSAFVLKDYGGEPNDRTGFSGIRLVGGGPFTSAGGWTDFDTAMVEVAPWLTKFVQNEVAEAEAKAKTLRTYLNETERAA